jgi:predicted SnoaL-like aldol condensation-catalyzing enzyme
MHNLVRNKEIVQRFWLARPREKATYLTDDSTWHLPTSIGQNQFGRCDLQGEEARAIFVQAATDVFEPGGSIDILHVVAEGDFVSLHCQVNSRLKGGAEYRGAYHMLFRLEGELIAETWEFLDTAYQAQCLGSSD